MDSPAAKQGDAWMPEDDRQYMRRPPAALLRPFVYDYQGYSEMAVDWRRQATIPSARVPMILGFGVPLRLPDRNSPSRESSSHGGFVAGLEERHGYYEWQGVSKGVQVDLTPIGAYQLLGRPMDSLSNTVVEVGDLFGRTGSELIAKLAYAEDWDARFELVDRFVAARLAVARPASPAVAWAWRRLNQTAGRLSVGSLAQDIGWSRKHLISQFRQQIGLPPKTMARILRFNALLGLIERGNELGWAALAQRCGYYDQSHLHRDFDEFTGSSPGEFLGRRLASGGVEGLLSTAQG
jgi:AraC-like DNA-binding protein